MPLGQDIALRVAIIGAGPSGLYAAEALRKAEVKAEIDCFDRLPTPYGLLRGGVAPDHQKIKQVEHYYERIFTEKNVRFIGNVAVGTDIEVQALKLHYDALIFAYGANTDKRLQIPGEHLIGSHTATEFVGWYNGIPDYQDRYFDLNTDTITIIGQGNVAIDVCRILAKTDEELKTSDITETARNVLRKSQVKHIHVIGRRGPVQAAFTNLEIKELGELTHCNIHISAADLILSDTDKIELTLKGNLMAQKNMDALRIIAGKKATAYAKKHIHFHFFKSPKEIKGEHKVSDIILEKNDLLGDAGTQRATGTGKTETLACGLVFRSIGYMGQALNGLPFDKDNNVISNTDGRITDQGSPIPGYYATGWIKRGAKGVLGSNKADSAETIEKLLEDLPRLQPCQHRDSETLIKSLEDRSIKTVSFSDWKTIDAAEKEAGQQVGKPREKFTNVQDMLNCIKTSHIN